MQLPREFPAAQTAGFRLGFVRHLPKPCLLLISFVAVGLAAAITTACLGQDFPPPPGPPGPGYPMPQNQQFGPGPASDAADQLRPWRPQCSAPLLASR